MKKLVLKKNAKVLFTCLIILASMLIYSKTDILGKLAQDNVFYQFTCVFSWIFILFCQPCLLSLIWEDK